MRSPASVVCLSLLLPSLSAATLPGPGTISIRSDIVALHPVLAGNASRALAARSPQSSTECSSDEKTCGIGCIPDSYTCCPDNEGGCSADEECDLGSNGKYGCCEKGETCTGPGGAIPGLDRDDESSDDLNGGPNGNRSDDASDGSNGDSDSTDSPSTDAADLYRPDLLILVGLASMVVAVGMV